MVSDMKTLPVCLESFGHDSIFVGQKTEKKYCGKKPNNLKIHYLQGSVYVLLLFFPLHTLHTIGPYIIILEPDDCNFYMHMLI